MDSKNYVCAKMLYLLGSSAIGRPLACSHSGVRHSKETEMESNT